MNKDRRNSPNEKTDYEKSELVNHLPTGSHTTNAKTNNSKSIDNAEHMDRLNADNQEFAVHSDRNWTSPSETIDFDPEADAKQLLERDNHSPESGTFSPVTLEDIESTHKDELNWKIDERLNTNMFKFLLKNNGKDETQGHPLDFLTTSSKGKKSTKQVVLPENMQISINSDTCFYVAEEIVERGHSTIDDIEFLLASCKGISNPNELQHNLKVCFEYADIEYFDDTGVSNNRVTESVTHLSVEDLAEAIDAILNRHTALPGARRFTFDRGKERALLNTLLNAKQALHRKILSSATVIESILDAANTSNNSQPIDCTTSENDRHSNCSSASKYEIPNDALARFNEWYANGMTQHGRGRRNGLLALRDMKLSTVFFHENLMLLTQKSTKAVDVRNVTDAVRGVETAQQVIVHEFLPFARRFAARETDWGEDPDDVFQVAGLGLLRAVHRLEPERTASISYYFFVSMKQQLSRWRCNEGSAVRVPVHVHPKIQDFDLRHQMNTTVSNKHSSTDHSANQTVCDEKDSILIGRIPRFPVYTNKISEWDKILGGYDCEFENSDVKSAINETLAELPERQERIIRLRYGLDGKACLTLEEIGVKFGVTRERIRQIEAKAMEALKFPPRKRKLQEILDWQ